MSHYNSSVDSARGLGQSDEDSVAPLSQRWQREEQERWQRHVRKMESIEEHFDHENVLRFWDYSHKKFRTRVAGGQPIDSARNTAAQTTATMTLTGTDSSAGAPEKTHELLQIGSSVPRQSVIMISKRKGVGGTSKDTDEMSTLPLLAPDPPSSRLSIEAEADEVIDAAEVKKDELTNLVDAEVENIENIEEILQVRHSVFVLIYVVNIVSHGAINIHIHSKEHFPKKVFDMVASD
jgi:hypothetical protein